MSLETVYTSAEDSITTEYVNNHTGKPVEKTVHVKKGDIYGNDFSSSEDEELKTTYSYDKNGNLETTTTTDGITTAYTYDNLNKQTNMSRPGKHI